MPVASAIFYTRPIAMLILEIGGGISVDVHTLFKVKDGPSVPLSVP
jgi:hypothetical protein